MTRHATTEYTAAMLSLCDLGKTTTREHYELGHTRVDHDELDVAKLLDMLIGFQNPFDLDTVPAELTNIVSGQVASSKVSKCLTNFVELGKSQHHLFMSKELLAMSKLASF